MSPARSRSALRQAGSDLARSDLVLVVAALAASLLGALLIHSATRADAGGAYLVRHLVNLAIGVGMAVLLLRVDRPTVRALAPVLYLAGIVGLVLVLTPLGTTVNGSRSWIQLPGGFSLQSSELAKAALCVALPMVLAPAAERRQRPTSREVLTALALTGLPVALIMLQPDLGSAMVLIALTAGVLVVAGVARGWLLGLSAAVVAAVVAAFTTPVLSAYQRDRLTAFLDPQADPLGIGYQTQQVRRAISGGGGTGQGLGAGELTQSGAIPFQETDFIFSVAGEELGFLGAGAIVLLLGLLIARIALAGWRTTDPFARLVCWAVATWFAVQTVENVGMNLGMLPVTGLPLPFLSYGGSSMLAGWVGIGLVLTVTRPPRPSSRREVARVTPR